VFYVSLFDVQLPEDDLKIKTCQIVSGLCVKV